MVSFKMKKHELEWKEKKDPSKSSVYVDLFFHSQSELILIRREVEIGSVKLWFIVNDLHQVAHHIAERFSVNSGILF